MRPWLSTTRATCALLALLVAACGGSGGSPDPQTASPATASPASASALSASVTAVLRTDLPSLDAGALPLPPHFAGVADNRPTVSAGDAAVAALGRVLFHDRQLSFNGSVSCASCHDQAQGFGDAARFSTGFDGQGKTTAHAMRLANLRFYQPGSMFWDKRAASLEVQSTLPIQHPVEMGFDPSHGGMAALLARVQGLSYYPELFAQAFGDAVATEPRVQEALSAFMRAMVSTHSRWDEAYAQVFDATLPDKGLGRDLPGFTAQENRGRHLFMASRADGGQACAACHQPPSFALGGSGNNGLDPGETVRFKSPSLKNVALSSNFMHDGRFSSLEQVVAHYSTGVQPSPGLDARLKAADGTPLRPDLPPQDQAALVAFMRTLSDPVLAADPRFGSPFRQDTAAR